MSCSALSVSEALVLWEEPTSHIKAGGNLLPYKMEKGLRCCSRCRISGHSFICYGHATICWPWKCQDDNWEDSVRALTPGYEPFHRELICLEEVYCLLLWVSLIDGKDYLAKYIEKLGNSHRGSGKLAYSKVRKLSASECGALKWFRKWYVNCYSTVLCFAVH